jgi:hypothetical protein
MRRIGLLVSVAAVLVASGCASTAPTAGRSIPASPFPTVAASTTTERPAATSALTSDSSSPLAPSPNAASVTMPPAPPTPVTKVVAPDFEPPSTAPIMLANCRYPTVRPASITLFCGDGGAGITRIAWTKWTHAGARGTGTFYQRNCAPDCAHGSSSEYPAQLAAAISGRNPVATFASVTVTVNGGSTNYSLGFDTPPTPPSLPANAPPASGLCTTTSSGTCIRGGEFCPTADEGTTGTDGAGRTYFCEDKTGSGRDHWETP